MSYKGIDNLKAAVDGIVASMDKIKQSNDLNEINTLEHEVSQRFKDTQNHLVASAWDLKQTVDKRRAEVKDLQDKELAKQAGL